MATTTSNDWPSCWSLKQKVIFVQNMNGYVSNQKLGCTCCQKFGTLNVGKKSRNENI
jgi:hypothetical protein